MDITKRRKPLSNVSLAILIFILSPALIFCGGASTPPSVNVDATVAAGILATQQAQANFQATVDTAIAATQAANQSTEEQLPEPTISPTPILPTSTPNPSAPLASTQPASMPDAEQVRAVILNEVNGAIAQDLVFLKSLYVPDAVVIDRNGTPDDSSDDTTWQGWANIERRYLAFFSAGYSSLNLVDLSIQLDGNQATGTHQGVVLDGTLYPDKGVYILEKSNGQWLITQLEFGNEAEYDNLQAGSEEATSRDDGLYVLELGNQHRYEEPWGWDRDDPCGAWATGNFDDSRPNYRGFNIELLLTNNSDTKVPDAWPVSFTTANGKSVQACYYGYDGSGPSPDTTSSVTFFTVVEEGDYVERVTFSLDDQTIHLCLDGEGGWTHC